MGRMDGKRCVVTGATAGLGWETALLFAEEGGRVIGVGRNEENGARLQEAAASLAGEVVFRRGDVRVEEDVAGAIAACETAWGGLDVMVNNAGILGPEGPLHETSTEGWDEVNDTNMRGVFFGTKHAILAMQQAGGGSIVQIGSILSSTGDPFLTAYTATKHGVLGLTRAVAVDYAARNIRCNCVCPGDMDTPMIQAYFAATPDPAAAREEMESAYPLKRIAHPREVAYACLYFACDESAFVSGTSLIVDGALTAKAY
jgi:NAD(P)-dependent dehydrogenase (short-subunit alcohol dehydrogenase family)